MQTATKVLMDGLDLMLAELLGGHMNPESLMQFHDIGIAVGSGQRLLSDGEAKLVQDACAVAVAVLLGARPN